MDRDKILLLCGARSAPLYAWDSVGSTNDEAKALARAGAPHGTAVAAARQTAGRGRLGRSFSSPAGMGIYLSAIYRFQLEAERLPVFTAWAAAAVCRMLAQLCPEARPEIKWTNDVLLDGRKICGILTESGLAGGRAAFTVVGVGVNLNRRREDFPPELRESAGSVLMATGRTTEPETAAGLLLRELDRAAEAFAAAGGGVPEAYVSRCATVGRRVRWLSGGETEAGRAVGIGPGGELLIDRDGGGRIALGWGEVSVTAET